MSRYHTQMVRLARSFVSGPAAAEDVAQEAWVGALRGIERFEGRSTVKTWLFRILVNCAKSRGIRDARCQPFSSLNTTSDDSAHPDRSALADRPRAGLWASTTDSLPNTPELEALNAETRAHITRALQHLPAAQRTVLELRDIAGFTASEVCAMLDLTEVNQRVLLHRGRSRLRHLLVGHVPRPGDGVGDEAKQPLAQV